MPGREPRKCCKRQSKYNIVYDCGPESQALILCEYHYGLHPAFQRNIKTIEEIKNANY